MLKGEDNILIQKLHQSPHVKRRIFERVLEMMDEEMTLARMGPVVDSTFALMQTDARLGLAQVGLGETRPGRTAAPARSGVTSRPGRATCRRPRPTIRSTMPPQTLFLNEIMADNDSVVADEMGDYDDWIEIVNLGSAPVTLGGYHLSDDIALPTKWAIPDTTLAPRSHRVLVRHGAARGADAHELPPREDRRVGGAVRTGRPTAGRRSTRRASAGRSRMSPTGAIPTAATTGA